MKVVWTRLALEDLQAARDYISASNPQGSARVAERIRRSVRQLPLKPGAGPADFLTPNSTPRPPHKQETLRPAANRMPGEGETAMASDKDKRGITSCEEAFISWPGLERWV